LARPRKRQLVADELAVVAIDHGGQVRPTVGTTINVRHVHRPSFVAARGSTAQSLDARPRRSDPLMDKPAFQPKDAIDSLAIHLQAEAKTQHRPNTAIPERRVLDDEMVNSGGQCLIQFRLRR